jgi:Flp pilus assembly protein TadG
MMLTRSHRPAWLRPAAGAQRRRRAAAAVEFAILLPVLTFFFLIAVDFGRVFYQTVLITSCARNGALYARDSVAQAYSPYSSVQAAAVAAAPNLSPAPQVSSSSGTDASGNGYVQVTVTYQFHTIADYVLPGEFAIPSSFNISRTVQMSTAPVTPN